MILGFSIGGGIDQDPTQNPFSEDKTDKVRGSLFFIAIRLSKHYWSAFVFCPLTQLTKVIVVILCRLSLCLTYPALYLLFSPTLHKPVLN